MTLFTSVAFNVSSCDTEHLPRKRFRVCLLLFSLFLNVWKTFFCILFTTLCYLLLTYLISLKLSWTATSILITPYMSDGFPHGPIGFFGNFPSSMSAWSWHLNWARSWEFSLFINSINFFNRGSFWRKQTRESWSRRWYSGSSSCPSRGKSSNVLGGQVLL